MKFVFVGLLFLSSAAYAQEVDPRLCVGQLNVAEQDNANMLRMLHQVGATRILLQSDYEAVKKERDELKKQLDDLKVAK